MDSCHDSALSLTTFLDAIESWVNSLHSTCLLRDRQKITEFCDQSFPKVIQEFVSHNNLLLAALRTRGYWDQLRSLELNLITSLQILHSVMPHIRTAPLDPSESFLPSAFVILQDTSVSSQLMSELLEIASSAFSHVIQEAVLLLRQLKYEVELAKSNNENLYLNPEFNRNCVQKEHLAIFKQEFTVKHADEINQLREDPNMKSCHIDLLVDIIESGSNIYSLAEKNITI